MCVIHETRAEHCVANSSTPKLLWRSVQTIRDVPMRTKQASRSGFTSNRLRHNKQAAHPVACQACRPHVACRHRGTTNTNVYIQYAQLMYVLHQKLRTSAARITTPSSTQHRAQNTTHTYSYIVQMMCLTPPSARCPAFCPCPLFARFSASTRPDSPANRRTCQTRTKFRMMNIAPVHHSMLMQSTAVGALRQWPLNGCGFLRSTAGAIGTSIRETPSVCTYTHLSPHRFRDRFCWQLDQE